MRMGSIADARHEDTPKHAERIGDHDTARSM
jgi:hypothetical protein